MRDSKTLPEQPLYNQHDAEMYAALWSAAPFPRLPEDAPVEIKNLMMDIDNPRKVYVIHKAVRRHEFQVLVEKFIIQIRYGCQSPKCHTKTCFSSRKRLARGAPVRRYNATSARTLAVYLASQDNPEEALCLNPKTEEDLNRRCAALKINGPVRKASSKLTAAESDSGPVAASNDTITNSIKTDGASGKDVLQYRKSPKRSNSPVNTGSSTLQGTSFSPTDLEETNKSDHKSFAQAVFGSSAFKMVEWLAPRSLQRLSGGRQASDQIHDETHQRKTEVVKETKPQILMSDEQSTHQNSVQPRDECIRPTSSNKDAMARPASPRTPSVANPMTQMNSTNSARNDNDISYQDKPVLKRKTSHVRTSSETLEHHTPRSMVNHPLKTVDGDLPRLSNLKPQKHAKVLQTRISTPSLHRPATPLHAIDHQPQSLNEIDAAVTSKDVPGSRSKQLATPGVASQKPCQATPQTPTSKTKHDNPQGLSHLPVEIILMLSDILTANNICQSHNLFPAQITDQVRVEPKLSKSPAVRLQKPSNITISPSTRQQWLDFVEQSIFTVFSRPDSLLKSFYHKDRLIDSMTMWYLLLRLTRISPTLVFDSMWRATELLYKPPDVLASTYDWRLSSEMDLAQCKSLSSHEAAHIISISMHALMAAAPLMQGTGQVAYMFRLRSGGSALPTRGSHPSEIAALRVRYNDAFTDEHALRLARRLFAAIPNRCSYAELMKPHRKEDPGACADVLALVLETLEFDWSQLPLIGFSPDKRIMHTAQAAVLILEWARTVMMQDWTGAAEIPFHGAFGGALMTISAIYQKRKSFMLDDTDFRTGYFNDRLDLIATARDWSIFEKNKRTFHILDYPYLFYPDTLVSCFRAINYSRMNQAYETAKSSSGMMSTAICHHSLMVDRTRRQRLAEQMRTANSSFLVLEIRRTHVLLDAFNSLWRREERELLRPVKLRLGEDSGEEGMDLGGVQQEFFGLAVAEALDPDYGTFTIDDRTRMTWFQPGSPEPLWKFELIGTIISLAVYNGLTLPITFPKALYRRLLGEDITELDHIQDGWPELAAGLTTLLEWGEADGAVEDVFARTYEFSVSQFGQHVSRDMLASENWPQFSQSTESDNPEDAPLVTNANRADYVRDYIRWLTDISIRPQFEAFKRGFFTCLTPRSITLFDAATLQSLIEGEQNIDVQELRRAARYQGWEASHRTVRDFWSVVKKFDIDQKRKLLEFVTASDRVPVGGMRNMQFTLQKNGQDDVHLPTSATCFGILLLPEYSSKEILREKLLTALENSKGFGSM